MWRITSWTPEARLTALMLLTMLAYLPACGPQQDLSPPKITLVPGEAPAGKRVIVTVHSDRVQFTDCSDISENSFTFSGDSGADSFIVDDVLLGSEPDTLIAGLVIDPDALGMFNVEFSCTPTTNLTGTFNVTKATSQPSFLINPKEVTAGEQGVKLEFSAEDGYTFGNEIIQVDFIFEPGQTIPITPTDIEYFPEITPDVMAITVNVGSWITQPDGITSIDALVQVTTDSNIFRSTLPIVEGNPVSIWIEGNNTFLRPSSGTGPLVYPVRVIGKNMLFSKGSVVSFPVGNNNDDTPGIVIIGNVVPENDNKELTFNIGLYDYAYIGASRLRVTTGGEFAETHMNIEAQIGDPVLELVPKEVPTGMADTPVLATAKNFEFDEFSVIECEEDGCDIYVQPIIGPTKQVYLTVTIDELFEPSNATVKVTNTASIMEVTETLLVVEPQGTTIFPTFDDTLVQGASEIINIEIAGENNFASNTKFNFHVLARSGLAIDYTDSNISGSSQTASLRFNVSKDAPTGPALVYIDVNDETLETLLTVLPSANVPWLTVEPNWIAQGRRSATLKLTARDFAFDELDTSFQFDDPAIQVTNFTIDAADDHIGDLTIELSPVANSDMTVLYVKVGEDKAAATFRVLDVDKPSFLAIEPQSIDRGESGVQFKITTDGSSFDTGAVFAEVMSGIGLEITDWSVDDTNNNILYVTINAEDTGPEGSVGILIKNDWHTVVAPIYIVDEALPTYDTTMGIEPGSVTLGSGPFQLELTIPAENPTKFSGFSEVYTDPAGTYATLPDVDSLDPKKATIALDIGFNVSQGAGQAIILATTDEGAAVGYIDILRPSDQSLVESSDPTWVPDAGIDLHEDWTAELNVTVEHEPAILYSSAGKSSYAGTNFELISSNNLDVENPTGVEFFWDDSPQALEQRFIISPMVDPLDDTIDAKVMSLLNDLDSSITEVSDPELSITQNPCDSPILAFGSIGEALLDEDKIVIEGLTTCQLAVAVTARNIIDRPWITPDLCFKDDAGNCIEIGWPTPADSDPTKYVAQGVTDSQSIIAAELGTEGNYLVNIRRPYIIREINRSITLPYIEIETEPGASLDNLMIQLFDKDGLEVANLSFIGLGVSNDGIIVVSGASMIDADLSDQAVSVFPTDESFGLRLFKDGNQVDAVWIGPDDNSLVLGEGDPIEGSDEFSTLKRISGIDTNDNSRDFLVFWQSSY